MNEASDDLGVLDLDQGQKLLWDLGKLCVPESSEQNICEEEMAEGCHRNETVAHAPVAINPFPFPTLAEQ